MTVPIDNRSVALGTCRLAQSLFLAFSRLTSDRLVRSEWETLLNVFRPWEDDGACWESIGGTWHMPIATGTILMFCLFANNVQTAGLVGMGESLIDVFRPREDDGAYWESIGGTWHMAIGTILIFSLFVNNARTTGPIGMGETLNNRWVLTSERWWCLLRIMAHVQIAKALLSCCTFHYLNYEHAYLRFWPQGNA